MVLPLNYTPPFEPDRNRNRESLAGLNQTISSIGDTALQYGQQQKQNKLQQAYLDLARRKQAQEEADSGPLYNGMDATPQGTTSWNPSPLDIGRQPWAQSPSAPSYGGGTPSGAPSPSNSPMGPQPQAQQYASAGTPDTGMSAPPQFPQGQPTAQSMHQPGTDLTSHFNAWNAQGQPPTYNHPEMGSIGQSDPMANMDWNQFRRMNKNQREGYSMFNKGQSETAYQNSQMTKNTADAAKANAEADFYKNYKGPALNATIGEKGSQFADKRLTALGDALDPSKARAGAFGVSKQVYDRAERLESLASAFKDGNLDSRQVEELAIGLNAMLSGANTGAAQQVKSLVPNSIWGNAQKVKEWLVNKPQGLQQQAFVSRMLGSISREKATAADQIKRTQFQRIGRYGDLEKSNPDEFGNVLQSDGIDPQEYQQWKKGGYKPMTAVQTPESGGGQSGGGWSYVGKVQP